MPHQSQAGPQARAQGEAVAVDAGDWMALGSLMLGAVGPVVGSALYVARSLASLTTSVEHLRGSIDAERAERREEIDKLRADVTAVRASLNGAGHVHQ